MLEENKDLNDHNRIALQMTINEKEMIHDVIKNIERVVDLLTMKKKDAIDAITEAMDIPPHMDHYMFGNLLPLLKNTRN